jgi:hypothetical protein
MVNGAARVQRHPRGNYEHVSGITRIETQVHLQVQRCVAQGRRLPMNDEPKISDTNLNNLIQLIEDMPGERPEEFSDTLAALRELLALREQTRWIPVSEKLPEAGTFVDVSVGGVLQNHTAHFYEGDWYWCDPEADPAPREVVTHWRARPLPPAPVPEVKP